MAQLGSALGRRSRQIGIVQEAAALAWVGRWGYSSSPTLAVLTNRQTQPRLIRAGLLRRELLRNPYAYVHSLALITDKGIKHLESLLEKIRLAGFLKEEAIKRGWAWRFVRTARAWLELYPQRPTHARAAASCTMPICRERRPRALPS